MIHYGMTCMNFCRYICKVGNYFISKSFYETHIMMPCGSKEKTMTMLNGQENIKVVILFVAV